MNVGDIVKITDKRNPNMWCSGIVINPENDYVWATVKTMHNDKWIVEGYDYDIEVIGAVEPMELGSIYIDENNKSWVRFSTLPSVTCPWSDEYGHAQTWKQIVGYSV